MLLGNKVSFEIRIKKLPGTRRKTYYALGSNLDCNNVYDGKLFRKKLKFGGIQ